MPDGNNKMEISSYVLLLSGKAELPRAIDLGYNYHIALSGSVRTSTDSDNDDGTLTRLFKFKPIKIEVLNELGETIKAKDTRSNSVLLRNLIYKRWANAASKMDFDSYYDAVMASAMVNIDKIIDSAKVE